MSGGSMLEAALQCAKNTQKFNEVAGNLKHVDMDSVDLQLSLLFEELTEAIDAFESKDAVGVLDGAADVFVVTMGLLQKLDKLGFNVAESLIRVSENNNSKFIPLGQAVHYEKGIISEYNDKYEVVVLKDLTGKVRKPVNFKPVNLSDCVPDSLTWGCADVDIQLS